MRVDTLALVVVWSVLPSIVHADPAERLEASGYIGVDYFGNDIGLGDSTAPEQRPQTAPAFGARLTYLAAESDEGVPLALGGELELSFTPSSTGSSPDDARPSTFAPVLDYRALFLVRLGTGWLRPHVVVGVGGATLLSSSTYVARDTDIVAQWGVGATLPMADRWQLRIDARQGRTEAREGGMTSTFELLLGVGTRFGATRKAPPRLEIEVATHEPPPSPPPVQEVVVAAPAPDPDGDHITGALDRCPDRAEDVDGWQDDDGCPDDDNDSDGIADAKDACPREPETKNGFVDEDGCPDQVPASLTAALAASTRVKFQGKATLTPSSKAVLDASIAPMLETKVKIAITAHPDGAGSASADLAARRAEAVKWYLVEQGVAQAQLVTKVGAAVKPSAAIIELSVIP